MRKRKRTAILVLETIGWVLCSAGFVTGVSVLLFGVRLIAIVIGAALGAGFGLLAGLEDES